MRWLMVAAMLSGLPAWAQDSPSQAQIADAVELGGLAALAPLCGLRDQGWSADLRRSTIQDGTGTPAYDDAGLKAAPGSNLVIGALSYAETEATEEFAQTPAATCGAIADGAALPRADDLVRRFRAGLPAS